MIMRRRRLELFKQHNDPEVTLNYVVAGASGAGTVTGNQGAGSEALLPCLSL
jgi:hypothetical protein